ncbi:hypothetical protein DOTSEDRAFT_75387 [Dothistroma septosporum NZE10]|uniref:Uncharacterized protein n=1 Tax=Dothistroma septosporum (strain NZE10 / CBS 128990) TaxID=675120 RepID=M2XJU0_DOTSN|nr:hypothetical protein DOTSEDRAFT_75387 [Dothistroma septosporum NZE10]
MGSTGLTSVWRVSSEKFVVPTAHPDTATIFVKYNRSVFSVLQLCTSCIRACYSISTCSGSK